MNKTDSNRSMAAAAGGSISSREGWALVLTAATLWGTTGIIFHALGTGGGANAVSISFLRLALSVPCILVMARIRLRSWLAPLSARGLATLVGLGVGMAAYQLTYVLAIERVGVAISVLISICGAPIFVALIAAVFMGERFKAPTLIALVVAIVGTVLLVGVPSEVVQDTHRFWIGVVIAIVCALCQAFYVLAARAASRVCHPMHAVGIGFAFGALALLPVGLHEGVQLHYSASGWAMLLYVAAVPTAIAQTLFLTGIKGTGAVGGAIASLLEPLVSTVLAVILLHETMSWVGMLGAAILLSGIVIVQWTPAERVKETVTEA
jgi:DME family drug/metabolite transporter